MPTHKIRVIACPCWLRPLWHGYWARSMSARPIGWPVARRHHARRDRHRLGCRGLALSPPRYRTSRGIAIDSGETEDEKALARPRWRFSPLRRQPLPRRRRSPISASATKPARASAGRSASVRWPSRLSGLERLHGRPLVEHPRPEPLPPGHLRPAARPDLHLQPDPRLATSGSGRWRSTSASAAAWTTTRSTT